MKKPHFIRYKLLITIIVGIIFSALAVVVVYDVRWNDRQEKKESLNVDMQSVKNVLESNLHTIFGALTFAEWGVQEYCAHHPDSLWGMTRGMLLKNEYLTGVGICLNSEFFRKEKSSLFVSYRDPSGIIHDKEQEGDYTNNRVWRQSLKSKWMTCIDSYLSPTSGAMVLKFVKPFYTKDSIPYCQLSFNCDPSIITKVVNDIINPKFIKVFVVSESGVVISSPNDEWMLKKFSEIELPYYTDRYMRFEETVSIMGWKIYMFCDWDNYFKASYESWMTIVIFFFVLIVLLVILCIIVRNLERNREQLLVSMLEQRKVQDEMHTAKAIQRGLLPKEDALELMPEEVKIFGWLQTAKEIGGDLYDYIYRDGKLIFCIGDVSGKGLPAALYMTAVISAFRVESAHSDSPAEIVSQMNNSFVRYNSDCMFVTMIVGILDLATGILTYTNAGHNLPVLIKKDCSSFIPLPKGTPVGFFEGAEYTELTLQLAPGEAIMLYTDGLTEAQDANGELFGDKRLIDSCNALIGKTVPEIVNCMNDRLSAFAGAAEQSDDITMLCI